MYEHLSWVVCYHFDGYCTHTLDRHSILNVYPYCTGSTTLGKETECPFEKSRTANAHLATCQQLYFRSCNRELRNVIDPLRRVFRNRLLLLHYSSASNTNAALLNSSTHPAAVHQCFSPSCVDFPRRSDISRMYVFIA
jgi:hypothetical protein